MITRKQLIEKLENMNNSDILVRYGDYRNCHPIAKSPMEKMLIELLGVKSVDARRYTNKRGVEHTSPAWLIAAYKKLAQFIYDGHDINVRMLMHSI